MKNLYLVIGKSGSGKDTLVDLLCEYYNASKVVSYTTRKQRYGEAANTHIFSDKEQYHKDKESNNIAAQTYFDGNYYWTTKDQLEECDFYVVDIKGAEDLIECNPTGKPIVVLYVEASVGNCLNRMLRRGGVTDVAAIRVIKRAYHDLTAFPMSKIKALNPQYINNDGDKEAAYKQAKTIIGFMEASDDK